MTHRLITLTMTLLLLADVRRSFVDPAPLDSATGTGHAGRDAPLDFDEVKQLEDLKHSFGKTFSVLKTHTSVYSDVNGRRQGHSESKEQVNNDGKLMARVDQKVDSAQEPGATPATLVRTELDIPDRGVHKTLLQSDLTESVERRSASGDSANNLDKLSSYSGIQYSPLDMAEYVFWTGDEKGVTLAIEEFLQEGLMSREEAISFLQDIKFNLEYLQAHYAQQRLHKQEEQLQAKERASLLQKALGLDKTRTLDSKQSNELATDLLLSKKSSTDLPTTVSNREVSISQSQQQTLGLSDQDYEELLERLRVADFLYTEYSLEEVIYQLAKVMFSQSLNRGSGEAQEALQKFTSFLESEAEQGHISRSLEKKVLDVLIASLTDTLTEHPHLVSAAREGLGSNLPKTAGNQLLHQLLLLNPAGASGETASAGTDINKSDKSHQSTLAKTREMMAAAESHKTT